MEKELLEITIEAKEELLGRIIPFWRNMRDSDYGGDYGYMSYDLETDRHFVKGCILGSRITWFFSNVYRLYKDGLLKDGDFTGHGYSAEDILDEAKHAYAFLRDKCFDEVNGGVYWAVTYEGDPSDTTKHTYNQAFAIYALSAYFMATGDEEALKRAIDLFDLIEYRCVDSKGGYLEARKINFAPESNEKLSENGVMAEKTMNTLLHIVEGYTGLYNALKSVADASKEYADKAEEVEKKLRAALGVFSSKIYNITLHRQEVFFDRYYNSLIDLHSYGHDIEGSWLYDETADAIGDPELAHKIRRITTDLSTNILNVAFDGHSLANECEKGVVNEHRIWWVQAETVVGFVNAAQRFTEAGNTEKAEEFIKAAYEQWKFIKTYVIDDRNGSEWFWEVNKDGTPIKGRPIVEPWKCPYHNGRMCIELIRRAYKA